MWRRIRTALGIGSVVALVACSSLLPRGEARTEKPWDSFERAHDAYASIQPYVTNIADLQRLGLDPLRTPNLTVLSYADILRQLVPAASSDIGLDPGIRDCLRNQRLCKGYAIEQRHLDRKRIGNFWLDFLDFHRETVTTGWRFRMLLLVVDNKVVYKTWGGQSEIAESDSTRNPLGPLQSLGGLGTARGF